MSSQRILGLDPGLRFCGWGVIDIQGYNYKWIEHGVIKIPTEQPIELRLNYLFKHLNDVAKSYKPHMVSLEKVFFNSNAQTSMLLGMARGVAALIPGMFGIPLYEYTPNCIKKSVLGAGHGSKEQVQQMVSTLLRPKKLLTFDSADALAAAICHAHNKNYNDISNATS